MKNRPVSFSGSLLLSQGLCRPKADGFGLGFLLCAALLCGCAPPGPRALLDGKKLIERGKYSEAIRKLSTATSLMPTNAQAWDYLGLACQYLGQTENAERAYGRALLYNHDLTEAHYNRACLWLAEDRPEKTEAAKTELLAYTLRRENSLPGLLKLGLAQLRLREVAGAEKSFSDALRISTNNPEALNGLGLCRMQRGRADEAARCFAAALKQKPVYRPALLNLAIVTQTNFKNRPEALQKFREYVSLKPEPADAPAVKHLILQLEQESVPPIHVARQPAPRSISTNLVSTRAPATNPSPIASQTRVETMNNVFRAPAPPSASTNFETVKLQSEPAFKPGEQVAPVQSISDSSRSSNAAIVATAQPDISHRGVLQRVNPLNLFRGEEKKNVRLTPLPTLGEPGQTHQTIPSDATFAADNPGVPRYVYKSPAKPVGGNRAEAQPLFDRGVQAQRSRQIAAATKAYQAAIQLDPAFFDAYYNLGLAATDAADLPASLSTYETALAIRPDSLDARYNFALVLKQSGYFVDAANELERVLQTYPNESRANLALANLYAQQLRQPGKAREHYLKVLESDPQNPQASSIRYWLAANP